MENKSPFAGYQLPTQPDFMASRGTHGFLTPVEDLVAQVHSVLPNRVLPIIFLPGIMGSNLRMNRERQKEMGRNENVSWRPDSKAEAIRLLNGDPAMRQMQLDPAATEVDDYDPISNPTGDASVTAEQRHDVVKVNHYAPVGVSIHSPLLMDDPVTAKPRKTRDQKARERGWGEVFFGSYQTVLEICEQRLNTAFAGGKLDSWWKNVVDVPPAKWQAHSLPELLPLDEGTLRNTVHGCWFPVHAMGYNWLQSNRESGIRVAERIKELIGRYQKRGFVCEKVILVTHSMGGLVARAAIHPDMGNVSDKVLGIVHGVMPAIGAGAAYKRMRCGFEEPGIAGMSVTASVIPKVLGNFGTEVTAVLANAPGGLELLPSQAYGNDWLQLVHRGKTLKSLPKNSDPYEEIYKLRGKWYGLLREHWINPAGRKYGSSFEHSCQRLDNAKAFHNEIANTYHEQSYAHYGADANRAARHNVVWTLDSTANVDKFDILQISGDSRQGRIRLREKTQIVTLHTGRMEYGATLQAPGDAGDQTVPVHSADHQLRSGKFKGIFRQSGYEHQESYKNERALHSTLYSLVKIASTMKWSFR